MEKTILKVGGMTCKHCANAVTNAVAGVAGTKDVFVDLEAGQASFYYDPSQASLDAIKAAIREEEYTVD